MARETLQLEIKDRVAHLRLACPDRLNTMTEAFWRELPEAFAELGAQPGVRAAVISSTGRHFTAGMDLAVFAELAKFDPATPEGRPRFVSKLLEYQAAIAAVAEARFPVIAAVQGGCIGGGVDLASACCLRYAMHDAYFVIQEINLGMMADVGTLNRMPKQIPEAVMRELAYTGRRLGAERAERIGFLNGVCASYDELMEAAFGAAREIAARAPVAVAASKRMISVARDESVEKSFEYLNAVQPGIFRIGDIQRSIEAMKAGRMTEYEDPPLKSA